VRYTKDQLKLGGFHLLMSFVGCIGQLLAESGLQEIFYVIYANNTVPLLLPIGI
jgi:hypothetical protein